MGTVRKFRSSREWTEPTHAEDDIQSVSDQVLTQRFEQGVLAAFVVSEQRTYLEG